MDCICAWNTVLEAINRFSVNEGFGNLDSPSPNGNLPRAGFYIILLILAVIALQTGKKNVRHNCLQQQGHVEVVQSLRNRIELTRIIRRMMIETIAKPISILQ